MDKDRFIQVILPLRIEWEPFYLIPEGMEPRPGDRVQVEFAGKRYVGVVSAVDVTPPEQLVPRILYIVGREELLPPVTEPEIRFWRALAGYYLCSVGEVYKAALQRDKQAKRPRKPAQQEPVPIVLSPGQEAAAGQIRAAFGEGKTALLHGVTGAGKTEIYLKLSQETLRQGRSVLLLVPEIALSRQLEERVAAAIPDVLVYHSAQTPARRAQVATALREEAGPHIVLGTRSALFLPHRSLGLVIVDEEHDRSFKQDSPAPRYHARESAIMLALIHGAAVLLGSATPSLESLYNADNGRFIKVDLKERFHKGEEARVMIIDTVAERRKNGMVGSLSLKLLEQIQRTLEEGGQAVLLRSRRAYAPAVQCTECGTVPRCPHCNVSLSLHTHPDRLVCHYCGHTQPYTGICPQCGGPLQPLGAGTQKIEEELQEIYPAARIARLDSDTAGEADVIRRFAEGEIDILVGTQIVTKGFDFARLSLVAVIQADNILSQQDFRSDEHALLLLEQFRGRSGRRGTPGLFVIQTREPGHPVFRRLQEDTPIAARMLEERRLFGYPPYTRLVHLTLKDSNPKRLDYLSRELAAALPLPGVVGPYTPVVDKIADQYIRQIRIMLPRDKALQDNKKRLLQSVLDFEKAQKYFGHLALDVDPV